MFEIWSYLNKIFVLIILYNIIESLNYNNDQKHLV